jgi:ribonuclease T2
MSVSAFSHADARRLSRTAGRDFTGMPSWLRNRLRPQLAAIFAVLVAVLVAAGPADAQDQRQNEAGQFDFYVLALSWSPSYCDARGARAPKMQCGGRPYSFVVHGLWPQYERGFPEHCQVPPPRLHREIVSSMLDLMPSPQLVFHEWGKHGTCSGLSPRSYFETVRRARAVVKIPAAYLAPTTELIVTPDEVEAAFVEANPGMPREAVSVNCDSRRIREVRICMTKDLGFRACEELDRRACRREKLVMPPLRGGSVEGTGTEAATAVE